MGLIHNHKFGTGPQKLVAAAVGLDEVKGNDDEGMVFKQGLSQRQPTLQPCSGAGKNQCRVITEWIGRLTSAISPFGLRTASAQLDGPRIITPSRTAWPPIAALLLIEG